jgi:uridine kinase
METMTLDDIEETILGEIEKLRSLKPNIIVAIDGRCAAGKTTLANRLQSLTDCTIIRMDHFFLRPEQGTPERMDEPGGNFDRERFLAEALAPLRSGHPFSYRPYDCHRQDFASPVDVTPAGLTVIEGSYSCHPALRDAYDLRIFLSVDASEQLERIRRRNGAEAAAIFERRWIPLEERYFAACGIERACDLRFRT